MYSDSLEAVGNNDSATQSSAQEEAAVLEAVQNNSALSESTCAAVRIFLEKAQNELGSLDAEIARVQLILNDLHLRRHTKIAEIDIYSTANAPMRRIANEILSFIFVLCCSDTSVSPVDKPTKQQYILGKVCSKWRQISLATPELWNRIHIDHSEHTRGRTPGAIPYPDFIQKSQHLRQLSGLAPLSLTFRHDIELVGGVLNPFLPDLARVTALSIKESGHAACALLTLPAGSLPSLHTLEFTHTECDLNEGSSILSSPNLREFLYTGNTPLEKSSRSWMAKLPLSQLTRLVVPTTFLAPTQLLSLLTLTPCLVEGSFAVSNHIAISEGIDVLSLPAGDSSHPPELAHMHTLELTLTSFTNCKDVQSIILPNLRRCIVSTVQATARAWDSGWTPTILRSGLLETLRIEDSFLSSSEIERILLKSPYLTELELGAGTMFSSSILQKMASGQFAPRLKKLRCAITFNDRNEFGAFDLHLDMLEQRKKETTPATHIAQVHFNMHTETEPSETFFPGLKRMGVLVKEGWNITKSRYF